jgi:hypothetical protein
MKSLTPNKRIALGFSLLIAVSAALGFVAHNRLLAVSSASANLARDPVPGTIAIMEVGGAFRSDFSRVATHVLSHRKEQIAATVRLNKAKIDRLLSDYEATITTNEDRRLFTTLKSMREAFVIELTQVLELSASGKSAEASTALETKLEPAYRRLDQTVDQLVTRNKGTLHAGINRVQASSQDGRFVIVFSLLASLSAGIVVAFVITRSIASDSEAITPRYVADPRREQAVLLKDASSMRAAMQAVQSASEDITKILKTVDDVAFHTDILALNATLEAARASEQGAGFGIVAEEVRTLAEGYAAAARETASRIEDCVAKSYQEGAPISAESIRHFAGIQTLIRQLDELVAQFSVPSNAQPQGIAE